MTPIDSSRLATRLQIEVDALRERQVRAPVDRIGLPAHVSLPRVGTCLAPAAGLLLSAECAADLGTGCADIDVGDATVGARRRQETFRVLQVVREDR